MPHISLRVTEQEKELMENYAKMCNIKLSEVIKSIFFEKLENEFDMKIIQEYEEEKKNGNIKYYTLDDVLMELNTDDDL